MNNLKSNINAGGYRGMNRPRAATPKSKNNPDQTIDKTPGKEEKKEKMTDPFYTDPDTIVNIEILPQWVLVEKPKPLKLNASRNLYEFNQLYRHEIMTEKVSDSVPEGLWGQDYLEWLTFMYTDTPGKNF